MKKETLRVLLFALSALFAIVLLDQLVITNLKNSQVNIINVALIFFFCVSGMYLLLVMRLPHYWKHHALYAKNMRLV